MKTSLASDALPTDAEMPAFFDMLARKFNEAGGVAGRRVELVTLDDGNDPKVAGENGRRLIEERSVVALFGYASATTGSTMLSRLANTPSPSDTKPVAGSQSRYTVLQVLCRSW